ncbi:head-tail adaptor [Mycobacterium phage Nibb]|uniref:Head-to-tail stopper n=1 Tax=Mycobacterium phage Nibb TaxID=2510585 RepID=A0A411B5D9_9CAUD|nr:head-tail adaptor [Mycobacterium phage Nibb]QAX95553.1 head-to-tail stopper [Mycobacterium phage Nibb]
MFPATHKVLHTTQVKVGENAAGQVKTEPRTRERFVVSLRSRVDEPGSAAADADQVLTEYTMVTPDPDWFHDDQVTDARGRKFLVQGEPEDYNLGPFGFTPGYRVTLRKVVKRAVPTA